MTMAKKCLCVIVGVIVNESEITDEVEYRTCDCKLPKNVRKLEEKLIFCPTCGEKFISKFRALKPSINVSPEWTIFTGTMQSIGGFLIHEHPNNGKYYIGNFLVGPQTWPNGYSSDIPDYIIKEADLEKIKQELISVLFPLDLWNPQTFGVHIVSLDHPLGSKFFKGNDEK